MATFGLGFLILVGFKKIEMALPRRHQGELTVTFSAGASHDGEVERSLRSAGLSLASRSIISAAREGGSRTVGWHVHWDGKREEREAPAAIRELEKRDGIQRFEFTITT